MMASDDWLVTDADGTLNWVTWGPEMDTAAMAILARAGVFIAGHRAFADMAKYWPEVANSADVSDAERAFARKLCAMPRAVIGRRCAQPVWDEDYTFDIAHLHAAVDQLSAHFGTVVAYGGVRTAQALISRNLVDELQVFVSPVSLMHGQTLTEWGENILLRFRVAAMHEFATGGALATLLPTNKSAGGSTQQ